jgi:hypothetical protein
LARNFKTTRLYFAARRFVCRFAHRVSLLVALRVVCASLWCVIVVCLHLRFVKFAFFLKFVPVSSLFPVFLPLRFGITVASSVVSVIVIPLHALAPLQICQRANPRSVVCHFLVVPNLFPSLVLQSEKKDLLETDLEVLLLAGWK